MPAQAAGLSLTIWRGSRKEPSDARTVIDQAILEKYNASLRPRKLKSCNVVLVMEL